MPPNPASRDDDISVGTASVLRTLRDASSSAALGLGATAALTDTRSRLRASSGPRVALQEPRSTNGPAAALALNGPSLSLLCRAPWASDPPLSDPAASNMLWDGWKATARALSAAAAAAAATAASSPHAHRRHLILGRRPGLECNVSMASPWQLLSVMSDLTVVAGVLLAGKLLQVRPWRAAAG